MKKLETILQSNIFYIILILFVILLCLFNNSKTSINLNDKIFKGTVEYIKISEDKVTIWLKGKERIIANYYLKDKKELKDIKKIKLGYGLKIYGTFNEPQNNTIPFNFNYKKYLKTKEIYLIMNTNKIKIIKKENILYKFKNYIIKIIDSKKNKEYYETFILGDKKYLDENIYNSYKTNGITHLFAISGMHISMLVLILSKIKIKNKIICVFLFLYSFLVMFTPSVLRVTIFYTLKNLKITKNITNIKLLLITAAIIILFNCNIIYDIGFIYSFVITLGLFLIKPKNIIALSLYAFIISLPIALYYNYEFNIFSILINIIIVPFVSFILYPIILLSIFIHLLEPILSILILVLEDTNILLSKYSVIIVTGKINIIEIMIYYLMLILFLKFKKIIMIFALIPLILFIKYKYIFDNNYYLYYLDVGQGDSSIIISPKRDNVIMIDTGGLIKYKNNNYKQSDSIITFLKGLGITNIDNLILTHGDYDHIGNAMNLIKDYKINNVIFNCGEFNELESNLTKMLDNKKIKYQSCIEKLSVYNNKLYFLNNKDYGNENDSSIVLYTKINNYKFLFMGDASLKTEKDIITKYNLKNIDVIKIGHHGSKTSTSEEFINNTSPKYSIISVGKNNRYGHPNNEVIDKLNKSKIYRTDKDGSIIFKIKNNMLNINAVQ